MELSDKDRQLINNLIDIAWQAGACRAPQMAREIENLRAKILAPKPPVEAPKV